MIRQRLTITRLGSLLPGDRCPRSRCSGHLYIYATRPPNDEGLATEYLTCNRCKRVPNDNKVIKSEARESIGSAY